MSSDRRKKDDRRTVDFGSPPIGERRRSLRRTTPERRDGKRIELDIWTEQSLKEETVFRQAGNLSVGGVFLEHGFSHPTGTKVSLSFMLPGDLTQFRLRAEVVDTVWDEGKPTGTSLRFEELDEQTETRINTFLDAQ